MPELEPPLAWFRERLAVIYPDDNFLDLHSSIDTDPAFRAFLTDLLARVDTGIKKIDARRISVPTLAEAVQKRARDILERRGSYLTPRGEILRLDEHGDIEAIKLIISHGNDTNTAPFRLDEESDGTQRLMHLAYALRGDEQAHPPVLVIDELDRSLHPLLTRFFLEEFLRADDTASAHQLICTTHDTNLLDVNLLPPSSIWFVEKDRAGSSHLYSLDEFDEAQLAALREHTEESYLAGRFGAIPFFGNRRRLITDPDQEDAGEG